MNCKNDSARVISKTSKDAEIIYRNHYERGWMKDSIASVTFDLASDQYSKGNYQKAKELYENANVIEPNNTIILNALGDVSANLNESDESIEYFEKSLKIDSTNYATYINFGTAYNKLLKFDKSIEVLLKGLEYANDREITGYFYYNLANSYYKAKEYKSSMEFNNKALDIIKESAVREDILELKKVLLEKNN
ncbi:tetratricopeptide repeat protein [Tenacibaculum sp.]|uniref:tetratricopeptide repeat protein n=1 Tax=Tenacibaculum sp. TaxID=1906242 RepID=UPI003AA94DE6